MSWNFTYRDFITYFFTGAIFIACVAGLYFDSILATLKIIDGHEALIVIFLIPLIYFIGHIIHSIDYCILVLHNMLWKSKKVSNFIKKISIFCATNNELPI